MGKIAIISDIHGNYTALKSVLNDLKKKNITRIYCLGDVMGKGTRPNECLDLLKDVEMVYGNWEDFFNNKMYSNELAKKNYNFLNKQISVENKSRLKKLPLCIEIYISGRLIRMFHATPNNAWDNVLEIDRIDNLYQQFLPTKNTTSNIADVVIYAHTHMQNMMKLYNRTLINVGSVGNAFDIIRNDDKDASINNTVNADYLIIEGNIDSKEYDDIRFEFISLKYDVSLELKESRLNPDLENYSRELLTGKFRNVNKYSTNFILSNYDISKL